MKKQLSSILAFVAYGLRNSKLTFIVGSKAAFFSISQVIAPLVGFYGGLQATLITYAIRTLLLPATLPSLSGILLLVYHIPSLSASAYLSSRSWVRAILPALAIVAYLVHPVGMQASWYALYWLIPLAIAFTTRFVFLQALGATFTAHAMGTLIYLYSGKLTYQAIVILTPIVAIERLTYAIGITAAIWVIHYATNMRNRIALKKYAVQEQIA